MRNRSRYSSAACLRAYSDVLADGHVREERVFLEDEADAPLFGRQVDAAIAVEEDEVVDRDSSRPRAREPGDRAEDRGLPGAGRTDERERRSDLETQLEVERPKSDVDLVEDEFCHVRPIRSPASRTMLKSTRTPPIASVASKFRSNSA